MKIFLMFFYISGFSSVDTQQVDKFNTMDECKAALIATEKQYTHNVFYCKGEVK